MLKHCADELGSLHSPRSWHKILGSLHFHHFMEQKFRCPKSQNQLGSSLSILECLPIMDHLFIFCMLLFSAYEVKMKPEKTTEEIDIKRKHTT